MRNTNENIADLLTALLVASYAESEREQNQLEHVPTIEETNELADYGTLF